MPSINIRETDNTVTTRQLAPTDNIVFVPGNATDGPLNVNKLCMSYLEFTDIYGSSSPSTSIMGTAWEYAANLTLQGFPVLFRRVGNPDEITLGNRTAKTTITSGETKTIVCSYLYPGTNGNQISVMLNNIPHSGLYLRYYRGHKLIHNVRLATYRYINDAGEEAFYDETSIENHESIWNNLLTTLSGTTPTYEDRHLRITFDSAVSEYDYESLGSTVLPAMLAVANNNKKFKFTGGSNFTENEVLNQLQPTAGDRVNIYAEMTSKYLTSVKFLTTGGHTVDQIGSENNFVRDMTDLANSRGDCLALIDIPYEKGGEEVMDYFQEVRDSYAAAYAPWVYMSLDVGGTKWMPPSFAFLYKLAKNHAANIPVYKPAAGVKRGLCPEVVDLSIQLTDSYIMAWQESNPQNVNPIMYLPRYGYTIFGQKTLYPAEMKSNMTPSALQDLSTRLMSIELKKILFTAAVNTSFEYNNIYTWNEFRLSVKPILDTMRSQGAISSYTLRMDDSTMSSDDLNSNTIKGILRVTVGRLSEHFDLLLDLRPDDINIYDNYEDII